MNKLKPNEIDANPTKEFFIQSLTKDISLTHVIPDLVDNCIDGARREGKIDNLDGLEIYIEVNKGHFLIKDNCGGMDLELARFYAFRFGRDTENIQTPGSIGQFGLGMKRAAFKLGNHIYIESKTKKDHFFINFKVNEWVKSSYWTLKYEEFTSANVATKLLDEGMLIKVTELYEDVQNEFDSDSFKSNLAVELERAYNNLFEKGLRIILNGKILGFKPLKFKTDELTPAYKKLELEIGTDKVIIELYAGVGQPQPSQAGWYIFCNGRLVLSADKSELTGWGEEKGYPQFHNYFTYFRGAAFFLSENTSLLPWDTTKTRINSDSKIYKVAKIEMIKQSIPVISFLKKIAKEKSKEEEGKGGHQPYNKMLEKSSEINVSALQLNQRNFEIPEPKPPSKPKPKINFIHYYMLEDKVKKVKKKLQVRSNEQLGIETFDYYYFHEIEDK